TGFERHNDAGRGRTSVWPRPGTPPRRPRVSRQSCRASVCLSDAEGETEEDMIPHAMKTSALAAMAPPTASRVRHDTCPDRAMTQLAAKGEAALGNSNAKVPLSALILEF